LGCFQSFTQCGQCRRSIAGTSPATGNTG
jgi:hypothetical protein